jgi:predicted small lipoprotein YifL
MKKIFLVLTFIGLVITLTGCGVKNNLDENNPDYPRNYPVY